MKSHHRKAEPVEAHTKTAPAKAAALPDTQPEESARAPADSGDATAQTEVGRVSGAPPQAAPLSAEAIEELKSRAAKADELYDQLLRKAADLENFKKRAAREKLDATRYANESLLQKLVPVLDNFDMALTAASAADGANVQSLQTGITMIYQQLKSALAEAGLEEVDAASQPFDPNWHEAVSQQETSDVAEGQVLQQVRKGYKLRDRLLRPAAVVVAKAPSG